MAAREGPVRARAERFASLRAALQAVAQLSSSAATPEPDHAELGDPGLRELEGWLHEAEHQAETSVWASSALLARIDRELDALAGEILGRLRGIPLSRLRASIPSARRTEPEGVSALLELCQESQRQRSDERSALDGAIALLRVPSGDGRGSSSAGAPRTAAGGSAPGPSDPLASIVQELQRRLLGATPGGGDAAAIAGALDLEKLSAFEKSVLCGGESTPPAPALRMAIALRLIAPKLSKLSQPLQALGLDPAKLRSERVPGLCATLASAMNALSSRRGLANARQLAELRGSLLAAWGEERAGRTVGHRQAARPHVVARLREAARGGRERALSARAPRRRWLRVAAALAVTATLALVVGAAVLFR